MPPFCVKRNFTIQSDTAFVSKQIAQSKATQLSCQKRVLQLKVTQLLLKNSYHNEALPKKTASTHPKQKTPLLSKRGFVFCKSISYASNGTTETNDLLSPFFWNFTTPSTFACKV